MRLSFRPLLFPALTLFLSFAGVSVVRADTISLSITELASGTLGSQSFANQAVTYTGSFTSQQLAACLDPASGCLDDPFSEQYTLSSFTGLLTTITVGGIGTVDANSGANFISFFYDGGSLNSIVPISGADSVGRLYFPTNPLDVTDCEEDFPSFYCPLSAYTSAGSLILTSVSDTYTTSTEVTSDSTVPEPSTLALLTTGFLALFGSMRGRFRSA